MKTKKLENVSRINKSSAVLNTLHSRAAARMLHAGHGNATAGQATSQQWAPSHGLCLMTDAKIIHVHLAAYSLQIRCVCAKQLQPLRSRCEETASAGAILPLTVQMVQRLKTLDSTLGFLLLSCLKSKSESPQGKHGNLSSAFWHSQHQICVPVAHFLLHLNTSGYNQ